jgi:hypothetical protein
MEEIEEGKIMIYFFKNNLNLALCVKYTKQDK